VLTEGQKAAVFSAKKSIESACRRLKLPKFTHHHFRHFFCSNAIEKGVDFKVIAAWLGHKDGGILVATTYGHLRAEHSAEMALRMTFDEPAIPIPANVIQLKPVDVATAKTSQNSGVDLAVSN
jgi:integrase